MEFKASEFENDIARSYDHFERAHGEDKRSKQEQILSRIRSAVAGLGTQQGDCPLTILSEKMEGEEVVVEFGGENCGSLALIIRRLYPSWEYSPAEEGRGRHQVRLNVKAIAEKVIAQTRNRIREIPA